MAGSSSALKKAKRPLRDSLSEASANCVNSQTLLPSHSTSTQHFSVFSMDEQPYLQIISEVGTHLSQRTRPNKDFIVKSLQKAANALSELKQSPQRRMAKEVQAAKKRDDALKPLADAVVRTGLLQHVDKEVKLLVAICVTELFRVKAPEPPFEDKYLRDVFKLIIGLFTDLADTKSSLFSKRVKVLDTVAQLRCCVIMLEIDCIDLVLEMFNVFFSAVRDDHHDSLINAMSSIMINMLNESEEASQKLLEVILRNLIKRKKDATCAAYQLAASVMKNCAQEDELNPLVCRFLSSCIYDRGAVSCGLKECYHEIIYQVFQCAPQMLIAVIPSLVEELLADQVDVRIKAVILVGKLFALPGHHVAQNYHDLFVEFLNRFSDKSVDVRISALQCARAIYVAHPHGSSESHEIITSVEGRLLDFDDRVRMQAVVVACDICSSNLMHAPLKLISQTTERLRDKKISVRKRALQKLIEIYQDYCKKCCEGSMLISCHFEEIPCKMMMLCYDKDCMEFRSQNLELVLADNLFPEHLSVEERTKHWIHMFSLFSSFHEKALHAILAQKRRLQNEMKNYLAMRKKLKELCAEETQEKLGSVFTKMAASFSDSQKAEEYLQNLNQMKDNNVFKSLERLLEEQTFTIGKAIKDELHVMIGDSNPHYEFLRSLYSKCSSNIFSSEHVQCILGYLSNNESGFKDLGNSSVNLLLAIVRIFPSMLKGSVWQFQMLLEQISPVNDRLIEVIMRNGSEKQFQMLLGKISPVNDKLIEVIAVAGPHISFNISYVYPFFKRMCLGGTRRQAKFAVSAIASWSSEQSVFLSLYEVCAQRLIDSVYSQWNVPTILQSLGCIAQCSASTFESRVEDITSYIWQNIIQVECLDDDDDDDDDLTSLHDTSQCSKSCKLKIYGLKTLISLLPYQRNHVEQNINGLMDILPRMLRENNKGHIRLAAAKATLRLARKSDLHITPDVFHSTILIAKDSSFFVRSKFLSKTHKLLAEHKLPIRYACAFALAVKDSMDDNYKHMAEFIKVYSIVARKRQTSAGGGVIIEYPAYILVYLIHVLAQSSDFPEACQDEKLWADLCSPLFFFLQALVDVSIVDGDLDLVNYAVLCIFSVFQAIRKAEDAVDSQMATKLHKLAEIGIFTLNALRHSEISVSQAPRQVLLPSSLYRMSLAKDDVNLKCPKSFFDKSFLSRVFDMLKRSSAYQTYVQKPAKTLLKPSHKGQQDVPRSTININGVLDFASGKPDNLPKRDITNARTVKPIIPSEKRRKNLPPSGSGSIGLHECSTNEKRQKLASKQVENTSDRNQLSSSDSVRCKGSLVESHVPTRKSKRAAACALENDLTGSKHAVHFKCPRTNLKDTCASKVFRSNYFGPTKRRFADEILGRRIPNKHTLNNLKRNVLADIANKKHTSHRDLGEHSSLSSIKETTATTGCLEASEGTSLNGEDNLGAESLNGSKKYTEASASEVVNTSLYSVRTRRKV